MELTLIKVFSEEFWFLILLCLGINLFVLRSYLGSLVMGFVVWGIGVTAPFLILNVFGGLLLEKSLWILIQNDWVSFNLSLLTSTALLGVIVQLIKYLYIKVKFQTVSG